VTRALASPVKSMLCGSTRCTRWRTLRDCWCGGEGLREARGEGHAKFSEILESRARCCFGRHDEPGGRKRRLIDAQPDFQCLAPVSPLSDRQQKSVVDAVAKHLLTSHGLRSLAPSEPAYKGELCGRSAGARFRLSSRNGMGLAVGRFPTGTTICDKDRAQPRASSSPWAKPFIPPAGHDCGNLWRRFAFPAAWMHRASPERRRTLPRLADPQRRLRVTKLRLDFSQTSIPFS